MMVTFGELVVQLLHTVFYKGWFIRDDFWRLVKFSQNLRDGDLLKGMKEKMNSKEGLFFDFMFLFVKIKGCD